MSLNRERERFNNPIILFNNQSLSMSKDSSNNILPLKFSPDEISRTVDLNCTMRVNLSDKGNLSLCNRDIKMAFGILVVFKVKPLWQMSKRFPEAISEYPRESCTMFFLSKPSMWFLIMVIPQKMFTGSSKSSKRRTIMSSKHSFLPEFIKTLNRCISAGFSLWDEYQMNSHEQMKADNLRKAVGVASSPCSRHLIIHLRYRGEPHKLPCFNKMTAKRDSLFVRELICGGCMSYNINSVK